MFSRKLQHLSEIKLLSHISNASLSIFKIKSVELTVSEMY